MKHDLMKNNTKRHYARILSEILFDVLGTKKKTSKVFRDNDYHPFLISQFSIFITLKLFITKKISQLPIYLAKVLFSPSKTMIPFPVSNLSRAIFVTLHNGKFLIFLSLSLETFFLYLVFNLSDFSRWNKFFMFRAFFETISNNISL